METLYDVIGARRDDDVESLKNAYRKAAKANHPDLHAGDPDAAVRFTRVTAAYSVLRNAEQRAAYDRLLLGRQLPPLRTKAKRADFRPAYRFVVKAIVVVVVGIMLAGGYILFVPATGMSGDDAVGMTTRQAPQMAAAMPMPTSEAMRETLADGPERAP
jgi:curved DNA-binding protein CbpA